MSVLQNFYKTTITKNWTATTGDFNVDIAPIPTSGWLVISPNNPTLREIVYYSAVGTNAFGAFITIANIGDRGLGGTTAQVHTIGETVRMNVTAQHWAELPTIFTGIIAPATTPIKIGDIYINTVLGKVYISAGISSSADWKILN